MNFNNGQHGFTLVEMLSVIGVIMLIAALALPGISQLMTQERWSEAVGNLQMMVMRARSIATSTRRDVAVEFDISQPGRTVMWLESENTDLERIPDVETLQQQTNGPEAIRTFMEDVFYPSGGRWESDHPYAGVTYDASLAEPRRFGDNARIADESALSDTLVIDAHNCSSFISWDAPTAEADSQPYGKDENPDIRIGPNGALLQTTEPIICLKVAGEEQRRHVAVVRCTGRVRKID